MPYIGKSPSFGVRNRFVYVADASDTSVSGADANGATLTFTDGAFVDVYLNGVLLKPTTDYNTNTANTIAGISSMSASDEVTVVVYDVFAVSDTVSATSGGTFVGNVAMSGTLGVTGLTTVSNAIQFNEVAKPSAGEAAIFRRNTDDNLYIQAADSGGSDKGVLILDGGQNTLAMFESSGINLVGDIDIETGDIFFSGSGKGINLGVTSNTDSNTLDDYEEGTWTASQSVGGNSSISASDEQYVKVGRMVHISLTISFSGSDTDRVSIAGLPFTATNSAAISTFFAGSAFSDFKVLVSGNTMLGSNTGGDANYTSVNGMTARFSGTYMATA